MGFNVVLLRCCFWVKSLSHFIHFRILTLNLGTPHSRDLSRESGVPFLLTLSGTFSMIPKWIIF